MTSIRDLGPFLPGEMDEVRLENAPLVRVLAQARWDELVQFGTGFEEKAQLFADAIGDAFPIVSRVQEAQFDVGPQGIVQRPGSTIFRFQSSDESVRVHFAPTFLTLETTQYQSREQFVHVFERALRAVHQAAKIPRVIRLGYRYVNRIDQSIDYEDLGQLISPHLLGGKGLPGLDDVHVEHSLSETLYSTSRGNLLAKWALLPPGASIDPTIESVSSPSWILDLDAYSEAKREFDPAALADATNSLSALGYGFFRWAVSDKFLERFGGRQS